MNFKNEKIDSLPDKFNAVNRSIQNVVNDLIESWDDDNRYNMVKGLKSEFDDMQALLKAFFVEVRLNILLLDEKQKSIYKDYCVISFKLFNEPVSAERIEKTMHKEFGGGTLSVDEIYYSADIAVSHDIGFYEASNYVLCYAMLLNYYYATIKRIVHSIPSVTINDVDLVSLDEKKNTISQKALVLHYLVMDKKLILNKISQDATKQAKILSFLFDNGYENLRKALTGIQESTSDRLKIAKNVEIVAALFDELGSEFAGVNKLIKADLQAINKK